MKQQSHVVHAKDGSVLHRGEAQSRRRFLAGLFAARATFRDADLSGWALNHHVMDGVDLRGADLTGADLSGSSLCGADLTGASLRGVKGDGLRLLNARLDRADLSPCPDGVRTLLRGADLGGADLSGAVLDGANLSGASCRATRFLKARARGATFRDADMVNAQFGLAEITSCDLAGARLGTASGAPAGSLPDRTAGATIRDNAYGDAAIDLGVPGFARDRRAGRLMRAAAWGVSALAVVGAAALVPEEAVSEVVRHAAEALPLPGGGHVAGIVGNGLVVVAALKVASLLRETVEHHTRERLGKGVGRTLRAAKAYAGEAVSRGMELANLVLASAAGPGRGLLLPALRATGGEGSFARQLASGRAVLLLCDRAHLARALVHLHVERTRDVHADRDLVLMRPLADAADGSSAPVAFRLRADGGASAAWWSGRRMSRASWDASGTLVDAEGVRGDVPTMGSAKAAFERALWDDHRIRRPWVSGTHQVAAGRDGSIQVVQERTGLLGNPWGPAFIAVDGTERHFRAGVEVDAPAPRGP